MPSADDPPENEPPASRADPSEGAPGGSREHPGLGRRNLTLLVAPIIALVVASNLGNAFFPTLSTEAPLLLIALNAANRNLVLAAAQLPFAPYLAVGVIRLLIPDIFFYALGHFYGDRAIVWMEQRTPRFGTMMRYLEDLFGRYGHAIVMVFPNNPVCLVAGAAHMRPRVFWTLNVIGTIGRVLLMWWIGDVFQGTIDSILGFIGDYRLPLTVVTVGLVGFTFLREVRTGSTEIQQLLDLDDDPEPSGEDDPKRIGP